MWLRRLPNLLGIARIALTPVLVALILVARPDTLLWATLVLLLMAISDILDGRIARRLRVVSPLGVFLDTISDKIFVAGALVALVERGLLSSWVALVILARDFALSGLRSFAAAEGQVISAGPLGKQKLVITVVALIWRLLAAHVEAGGQLGALAGGAGRAFLALWPVPMALAVIWTVASAVNYFVNAWPLIRRTL